MRKPMRWNKEVTKNPRVLHLHSFNPSNAEISEFSVKMYFK